MTETPAGKGAAARDWFRPILTIILLALSAWWLWEVAVRLGVPPTKDAEGNIIIDEFQRAKDILLVVLPLTTTALGYWFGVQGKSAAEQRATVAGEKADQASAALNAVVAASADPDLLSRAMEKYPDSFPK